MARPLAWDTAFSSNITYVISKWTIAVSVGVARRPGLISWDRTMSMYDERIRHSIDVAALCAAYSTCVLSLSESRRISHGQRAHLFWVNAFSLASSWVDHDEPGLLEALLAIAPAAF